MTDPTSKGKEAASRGHRARDGRHGGHARDDRPGVRLLGEDGTADQRRQDGTGRRGRSRDRPEKAGITQLHTSISSTEQQIKALQTGAQSTTQPAASTAGSTPGELEHFGPGTASVANASTQSALLAHHPRICGGGSRRSLGRGCCTRAECCTGGSRSARRSPRARSGSGPRTDADDHPHDTATTTAAATAATAGDDHDRGLRLCVMTTASTVLGTARAMATDVTVHGTGARGAAAEKAARDALLRFHDVDTTCTRFDPASPLMRVNARPDRWHEVPPTLFLAIQEAHRAHQKTKGRFDPRVLRSLVGLGYDRSLAFSGGGVETTSAGTLQPPARAVAATIPGWPAPQLHIGREPVDLGGIGKGLALRWASEQLEADVDDFLIDAGGDIACRGQGPDGDGWKVGVEDPRGGSAPLAVVALRDMACATSSIRLRRWRCEGRSVHHLVDPRSGRPGGAGLSAVTVDRTRSGRRRGPEQVLVPRRSPPHRRRGGPAGRGSVLGDLRRHGR